MATMLDATATVSETDAADGRRFDEAAPTSGIARAAAAAVAADRLTWILANGRDGDDTQMVRLAAALGWPYEVVQVRHNIARIIGDRVLDACGKGRLEPGAIPAGPLPDLVLAVGGRSVSMARRIRTASGGRTRLVFIGGPYAALDSFDLIIATAQQGLPRRANVVQNLLPLNSPGDREIEAAGARWAGQFESLPRPRLAVLIGGSNSSIRITPASAERLAERANALAEQAGGSLLVTTSRRTPAAVADALVGKLHAPAYVYRWLANDANNPYLGLLASADAFLVTSDSASMMADALSTRRPVEIFDLDQRLSSRILTSSWIAGADARPAGPQGRSTATDGFRARLIDRGYWTPARDLRRLHDALRANGLLGASDRPPVERPREADLRRAVERIRGLFGSDPSSAEA
jgi:uncharacterized protein